MTEVQEYSPVLSDLPFGYISGKVHTEGVTADTEGWYYRPGCPLTISANQTFKKATNGDKVVGHATSGIHSDEGPLSSRSMISVALFRGRRVDVITAGELLAAGDEVYVTYAGAAMKSGTALTGTVAIDIPALVVATDPKTGVTGTVDGATCTIDIPALSGATTATEDTAGTCAITSNIPIGIVWKGAASAAAAEVIIY